MLRKDQKGFTLIELLIVIVIIGILAGVLIAVINPVEQQNRARDAVVKATLNKIALNIKSYQSAYGQLPDEVALLSSLSGATDRGTECASGTDANCRFAIAGAALEASCDASGYNNSSSGTTQCYYYYYSSALTNNQFNLLAKSWGSSSVFVYRYNLAASVVEQMYLCPATFAYNADPAGTCIAQ